MCICVFFVFDAAAATPGNPDGPGLARSYPKGVVTHHTLPLRPEGRSRHSSGKPTHKGSAP